MSSNTTISSRQTKYVSAVSNALRVLQHATNLELQLEVQKIYPEVSSTTIHRVTARLSERGVIGRAPKPTNGSERYDSTPTPHHHFSCNSCGKLCDVPETEEATLIINQLKEISEECAVPGTLTMCGICKTCAADKFMK